jgi:radical SAM superfamily enzyme YgiQ (UPF0313 family)
MSVILVNPPTLYQVSKLTGVDKKAYFEISREQLGKKGYWSLPGEHLGLRSIQAACKKHGIDVEVINGQVLHHRSVRETWESILSSARRSSPPLLVGFSGPCQVFPENQELAKLAKRHFPGCLTIMGHDFATLNYPRILAQHPEFDLVCLGEAEKSFPELAGAILAGNAIDAIPGGLCKTP